MEAARWNLRECSVRLRRCDFADCGSAARAEKVAPAVTRELVTPAASVNVKENDFLMKIEDGTDKIIIKQELDIGPTVLQPKTVAHPLPPLTLVSAHTSSNIPSIIQINPAAPCPSTGSAKGVGPAPPCLKPIQPEGGAHIEVGDDHCVKYSQILADSNLLPHLAGDVCHRVLNEQSCDLSRERESETSMSTLQKRQGGYCVRASTETDCTTKLGLIKHTNTTSMRVWKKPCKSNQYICSTSQIDSSKIDTHMGETPYSCERSEYASQPTHLKKHMRTHTSRKLYRCEQCDYSTSRSGRFTIHMRTHTGEKPYKCEQCEYCASQLSRIKEHMRIHMGVKPYRCSHCKFTAFRLFNLKTHMRTHTGEKPYRCELCEYSASRPRSLKEHMRTHTGEKPYRCELCEYSASRPKTLKEHMRTHTGEKPYRCELCEFNAFRLGHLKVHMSIHTGEKPYKCDECEYRAPRSGDLIKHMRTHTGEKPYSCKYCVYSTSHSSNLIIHMRTHTGEKAYECEQCDYRASQLSSVKAHMKTHIGVKLTGVSSLGTVHRNQGI